MEATASAPVNIACIKYWGKRDTTLVLPTNSSLSVTLDQDHLASTTTARADPAFTTDRLWLNGIEQQISPASRLHTCISAMRRLRKHLEASQPTAVPLSTYHLHIASFNNFPTAAGLASSASGFAALVASLAQLYQLPISPSALSIIARQGSGSACRSLYGGFVAWQHGVAPDGSDSLAVQIAPESHWPDMHALICIVSDDKKATSSTAGMQRTVHSSALLQHRIAHVVPQRMAHISAAIRARDFDTFARITMADSNQFHAVALDTDPPIFYMNDVSRAIVALIVEYNRISIDAGQGRKAAYTFDAGPNAVIYTLKHNVKDIIQLIINYFPQRQGSFNDVFSLFDGLDIAHVPAKSLDGFNDAVVKKHDLGAVKALIHTKVGDGPRALDKQASLLGSDGLPK